jgi:hypothetical protein
VEEQRCEHPHEGGVYGNGDPYGTLRKLGKSLNWNYGYICWDCWDKWGRKRDDIQRKMVDDLARADGRCGFLEAWIGHCLNALPCPKHQTQKCWKCQEPAVRNCAETGLLVCGMPECDEHPHLHGSR